MSEINKKFFEKEKPEISERERESLEEKEITLENLTNEDILKAIIIWYQQGNTMLNLAQRWRIGLWKLYQKDPEKFLRDYFDPDASIGSVKSDLLNYQSFERRFGFKTEEVGGYGNPKAKLRLKFDPKSQELNQQKRKILFVVDTNDIGDDKDVCCASYLLAKKIIEEWKKIGLPIREKFGNLSEEEEKEILEVEKDEEKLKELWLSLRIGYKEEDLEKWRKEEEEEKKEFGLK